MRNNRVNPSQTQKKTLYWIILKKLKKRFFKIFTKRIPLSPSFVALVANIAILLFLVAIGFWLGIFIESKQKRVYGQHCNRDSECDLNLTCQNGVCNCSTTSYYNSTNFTCVAKKLNSIACSNDIECCCDLKCLQNGKTKLCSCPSERLWNSSLLICKRGSYYNETCSSTSECTLNSNLFCVNSRCDCSNSNMYFWNGTYCDTLQSYLGTCKMSAGCNQTQGLVCNITELAHYKCVCQPYFYWDSTQSICLVQKINNESCTSTSQCKSDTGLFCDPSFANTCRCPSKYYWSTNTCLMRKNYGEYCDASLLCDTTTSLSCLNNYCVCAWNKFWNGTYCVPMISSGISCNNSFLCDSFLGLICDQTYKQCVCASTHYWTGSICKLKEINGTFCTQTHQCQTQNGLSCISNRCSCAQYHYWSGSTCVLKQSVNTFCAQTYQCQDYNALTCINIAGQLTCECNYQRFWNGSQCVIKYSYGVACTSDAECYHYRGLVCYGTCRCVKTQYWNGATCTNKFNNGIACTADEQCLNNYLGVTCVNGFCNCMPLMYWSGLRCEFKVSNTIPCSGTNPACQDYAGLTCNTGTCQCSSTQFWLINKCQNYVDINQYCDGTTYICKTGLTCQGIAAGNFICQCATGTYWDGTTCAIVKTYNEVCDGWKVPCDYSKKLVCISSSESTSCLTGFTGTKCSCIKTDYWNGIECVPRKENAVLSYSDCECRQDLGLYSLPYDATYTCYTNTLPTYQCACSSAQYWSGEKCVNKLTEHDYCVTDCQCKENLLLKCRAYYIGYSCYTNFGTGKMCLCEPVTQWWTGTTCLNKYWHLQSCSGDSCECREDKLLSCRIYNYNEHYSCISAYSAYACVCAFNYYWLDATSGCMLRGGVNAGCTNDCTCRQDLDLVCSAYYMSSECRYASTILQCNCPTTHFWDSLLGRCVLKYPLLTTCTTSCQCDDSKGLICRDQSYTCNGFAGYKCVCPYDQYWDGTRCQIKILHDLSCNGTSCLCREDLLLSCRSYVYSEHYSCVAAYSGFKCVCPLYYYWHTSSVCLQRGGVNAACTSSCSCRQDLGLECSYYYMSSDCRIASSILQCNCPSTHFWDTSLGRCVQKYALLTTCSSPYNCQCDDSKGLVCRDQSYTCNGFAGYKCVCPYDQYWDGIRCQIKLTHYATCNSSSCLCREDLLLSCRTYVYTDHYSCIGSYTGFKCVCPANYFWNGWTCTPKIVYWGSCSPSYGSCQCEGNSWNCNYHSSYTYYDYYGTPYTYNYYYCY